jgi:transcriptional regulator with XRE-family HTH domain
MMNKSELADWFEKKYLEWQLANGRKSLDEFAKVLQISRGYLSQIMNGDKEKIGYKSALIIADVLHDDSLLTILDYERPETQDGLIESLPAALRSDLRSALVEIRQTFKEREITSSSEEAEQLAESILKKYGFKSNSN